MRRLVLIIMILFLAGLVYIQGGNLKKAEAKSIELPVIYSELKDGEGKIKAEILCNMCHSTDYITMQPMFSKDEWTATVNKMVKVYGAPVSEDDAKIIISYLAQHYGKPVK